MVKKPRVNGERTYGLLVFGACLSLREDDCTRQSHTHIRFDQHKLHKTTSIIFALNTDSYFHFIKHSQNNAATSLRSSLELKIMDTVLINAERLTYVKNDTSG